ncbi:hypothetical protein B0H13DRAFT_1898621 [Mycena leptocephala]|nr:hypothetical protein B0H13DRAFT_1898621 [Mycena leptocephala]
MTLASARRGFDTLKTRGRLTIKAGKKKSVASTVTVNGSVGHRTPLISKFRAACKCSARPTSPPLRKAHNQGNKGSAGKKKSVASTWVLFLQSPKDRIPSRLTIQSFYSNSPIHSTELLSTVLTLDEIKAGPINSSRMMKELVGIASAMGIITAGPKKVLLGRVEEKLSSDKTLAEKAEFLKFSIYHAKPTGRPPRTSRTAPTKPLKMPLRRRQISQLQGEFHRTVEKVHNSGGRWLQIRRKLPDAVPKSINFPRVDDTNTIKNVDSLRDNYQNSATSRGFLSAQLVFNGSCRKGVLCMACCVADGPRNPADGTACGGLKAELNLRQGLWATEDHQ